ncbi:hypothetical protein [Phenylobacterium sp.]|uniref:hypothetical protein n=1 Tax=Phenylobacterium sp. TaxID=1871053 RepID=UPI002C5C07A4|nr:hypothetical protein [Phenylobacterium sp.]HLZ73444.1 hypothetical protein [Phenylobacterium sp.]
MSAPSSSMGDTMTDTPFDRPASPPAPARPVRPFFWSVRRELWENPAIWIAPLAVAALVIVGACVAALSTHGGKSVHRTVATAAQTAPPSQTTTISQSTPDGGVTVQKVIKVEGPPPTPEQRRAMVALPFYMVTAAMLVTMFLVAVFYCLGGLFNERRDRSILFWKSLPVGNLTTVLAKIVAPMVILPAVTLAIALATEVTLYAIGALAFATHGQGADADVPVPFADIVAVAAYSTVVLSLWWAPVYAWLLMVSGWAKRAPFLWAVLPPLGLAVAERIAFGTTYLGRLIQSRLTGAGETAFVVPKPPAHGIPSIGIEQIDAAKFVSSPGLWLGLLAAAGMIAVAVWMRRRREPI